VSGYPRRAISRAACWPIGWVVFGRDTRHALVWLDGVQHSGNALEMLYGFLYNDLVIRAFRLVLVSGLAPLPAGFVQHAQYR
jgi:hypothetical protein